MGWQELVLIVVFVAVAIVPGFWLYRDVVRRGGNPLPWVGAYALAAAAPWRFFLVPIIFIAWFVIRGWYRGERR